MKKRRLLKTAFFLLSASVFLAQTPRVVRVNNLFSDDLGARESLFFDVFGIGGGGFGAPVWSPDGARVAFDFGSLSQTPDEEPNGMICIVNADGTGLHIVSSQWDMHPSWSPDCTQIAFTSPRTGTETLDFQIYKMNADGTGQVQLTTSGGYNPDWSPEGTRIAFNNHGIWIMNSDGTGLWQVSTHPRDLAPSWSPDGGKIAFVSERNGTENLWVMNSDGTNLTQVTQNGARWASWSPEGNWIAFDRDDQIWLIHPDGTGEAHLPTTFSARSPDWSPDGKKIVFSGIIDLRFDHDLYVMTLR